MCVCFVVVDDVDVVVVVVACFCLFGCVCVFGWVELGLARLFIVSISLL